MRHLAKSFSTSLAVAALLTAALLTEASHAQPFPESDRQKAAEARKKDYEKATDEAYKATIKRTQDVNKTADPWGNLRTPATGGGK